MDHLSPTQSVPAWVLKLKFSFALYSRTVTRLSLANEKQVTARWVLVLSYNQVQVTVTSRATMYATR